MESKIIHLGRLKCYLGKSKSVALVWFDQWSKIFVLNPAVTGRRYTSYWYAYLLQLFKCSSVDMDATRKFNEGSEEGSVFLLPFETFILTLKPSISEKSISFMVLKA